MDDRIFNDIPTGLNEAADIKKGKVAPGKATEMLEPDAGNTRSKLKLSRSQFADLLGVSIRTVEKWEQGATRPSGAARSLLLVTDKNPQAVLEALH